jgi:alpha-beta hydrolase superfamily lysophospholipase
LLLEISGRALAAIGRFASSDVKSHRPTPQFRTIQVCPKDLRTLPAHPAVSWHSGFDAWANATWATDPEGAKASPAYIRAPNGVIQDSQDYWAVGKAYYDPAKVTVPTLLVQAEWDRDLPPYMAQTLFPLLVNSPGKRYVMLVEGTHTIIMEKNRLQLFEAVQAFLNEASRS